MRARFSVLNGKWEERGTARVEDTRIPVCLYIFRQSDFFSSTFVSSLGVAAQFVLYGSEERGEFWLYMLTEKVHAEREREEKDLSPPPPL